MTPRDASGTQAGSPGGLRRPAPLRAGSHVRVVALSGPVQAQRLERGTALLTAAGLTVSHGAHVQDRDPGLRYLAGPDDARAAAFVDAWCDPAVDAVWAARGGYGALRVLDLLDWPALAAAGPKTFVGSSDLTVLLNAFAARLGLVTFHGPTAASQVLAGPAAELASSASWASMEAALLHPHDGQLLRGATVLRGGRASGITVGGNLTMLASLAASPDLVPAAGAIALLEDVHEEPYRLDRMLTQLRRAGWFEGVAGIACGSWQDCGDPATVRAVLEDRLLPLGVPVLDGLPFGHGPVQSTVPFGVPAVLDCDTGTLCV